MQSTGGLASLPSSRQHKLVREGALARISAWVGQIRRHSEARAMTRTLHNVNSERRSSLQHSPMAGGPGGAAVHERSGPGTPAQLYSEACEGDISPEHLLGLLSDTDRRMRAGLPVPLLSPAEEAALGKAPSLPAAARTRTQRHTRSGQRQNRRKSSKAPGFTGFSRPRTPSNPAHGRLHRALLPTPTSSLTAHAAMNNLAAIRMASERESSIRSQRDRSRTARSRSPTPPAVPAVQTDPCQARLASEGAVGGCSHESDVPNTELHSLYPASFPSSSSPCATPAPKQTKRQRRREARRRRAAQRAAHVAAMAQPVRHKCVEKTLSRHERLKVELKQIQAVRDAALAGRRVSLPPPSSRTQADTHSIGLGAASQVDNRLVAKIAAARAAAARAIDLASATRAGHIPGVGISSPYALPVIPPAMGWNTSAVARPISSPPRPRSAAVRRPASAGQAAVSSDTASVW